MDFIREIIFWKEILCSNNETPNFFSIMCAEDNMIIENLIMQQSESIPKMTLIQLKDIIFRKLKLNKAGDIHRLTVEHLKYSGSACLKILLQKITNEIIADVKLISSPSLNMPLATPVYKAKEKPLNNHKSYRLVIIQPLI